MKLICFDCDSTLSSVEGIDELARLRGPEVFASVVALTEDAMNGKIRIEEIFGLRLEAIRPTREDTAAVGRAYIGAMEPTAKSVSGVASLSTSLENTHRCPARSRRSSPRLRRRTGSSASPLGVPDSSATTDIRREY